MNNELGTASFSGVYAILCQGVPGDTMAYLVTRWAVQALPLHRGLCIRSAAGLLHMWHGLGVMAPCWLAF